MHMVHNTPTLNTVGALENASKEFNDVLNYQDERFMDHDSYFFSIIPFNVKLIKKLVKSLLFCERIHIYFNYNIYQYW